MSKILIIEDDESMVKMLSSRLENKDFTVVSAGDGLGGTNMAHSEKPDLIILDLILPVGGGLTTLRNLKMSENTKAIPIVVMTGSGDTKLKDDVLSMGVECFYSKPFDPNDMITKIIELLSK